MAFESISPTSYLFPLPATDSSFESASLAAACAAARFSSAVFTAAYEAKCGWVGQA